MVFTMKMLGANELNSFLIKISKKMEKEIEKSGDEFMKFVQKSAKLRAPRITGALAQSILLQKLNKKQIEIEVTSPYGVFQETGFTPHLISVYAPTRSGIRFGEIYGLPSGKAFVSKFTPFIAPALEQGLNMLPQLINKHLDKALKSSGGNK